jgi:DNA-binding protein
VAFTGGVPMSEKAEDNVIFVGKKPSMAYVLGVITQFSDGQSEIHIKARGKSISRAVDVAEIVRKRFITDVQIRGIQINTEERELEDKTKINVSTIDIILGK